MDIDVLIVTAGGTAGWRASARELEAACTAAGVSAVTVSAGPVREVRTLMLTDLVQAWAARRAAQGALRRQEPAAIVYCSITAALLWPRPGAIWLDSLAAENRPGRHGVWQRIVERRRLASAPLVMTMAPYPPRTSGIAGASGIGGVSGIAGASGIGGALGRGEVVVVPTAVDPSGPLDGVRDVDVVAYAADPVKRRLADILAAWGRARRGDETLVVTGTQRGDDLPGVRFAGRLSPADHRALLRRARVFVAAPRREDFGITALEALADGCLLVTTPAPGSYPALGLARELDPRLVSEDLAGALRIALDDPRAGYPARAAALLAPFHRAAVTATITERVLPRLLPGLVA